MKRLLCLLCLMPLFATAQEAAAPEPNYVYWSELERIVDGNTVLMNIDLGFGVWVHKQSLTLLDSGSAGASEEDKARNNDRIKKIRELFEDGTDIIVKTTRDKDTKPPRYLAEIWIDGKSLNAALRETFP